MDINQIKQLIDLMEERSLSDLELQDGDKKVALKRHLGQTVVASPAPVQAVATENLPPKGQPKFAHGRGVLCRSKSK